MNRITISTQVSLTTVFIIDAKTEVYVLSYNLTQHTCEHVSNCQASYKNVVWLF